MPYHNDHVDEGSIVELREVDGPAIRRLELVDLYRHTASSANVVVSRASPKGRELYGRHVGARITIRDTEFYIASIAGAVDVPPRVADAPDPLPQELPQRVDQPRSGWSRWRAGRRRKRELAAVARVTQRNQMRIALIHERIKHLEKARRQSSDADLRRRIDIAVAEHRRNLDM